MKSTFSVINTPQASGSEKDGQFPSWDASRWTAARHSSAANWPSIQTVGHQRGRVTGRSTAALKRTVCLTRCGYASTTNIIRKSWSVTTLSLAEGENAFLGLVLPHADAGVPPAQRGPRETGGGRHESQRHAAWKVPHRLQAPARVPSTSATMWRTSPWKSLPRLSSPTLRCSCARTSTAAPIPTVASVCPLRTMVFIAINNEWLTRDPFREYEIKKEEPTAVSLTERLEIRLLMEGETENAKQEFTAIYTCSAPSRVVVRRHAQPDGREYPHLLDEHEWININRQKTGRGVQHPPFDIANRIIDKYRGLCGDGRIFPVPHYNTCLLSVPSLRCGIKISRGITCRQHGSLRRCSSPTAFPLKRWVPCWGHTRA